MSIDQYILKESKMRRKIKLWHGLITKLDNSLKLFKISDEVMKFIKKIMKNWRVELTAGGKSLGEKQRGIF